LLNKFTNKSKLSPELAVDGVVASLGLRLLR